MRERFAISNRLEHYNDEILSKIVERSSDILDLSIDSDSALKLKKK